MAQAEALKVEAQAADGEKRSWDAKVKGFEADLAVVPGPTDADVARYESTKASLDTALRNLSERIKQSEAALDTIADPFNARARVAAAQEAELATKSALVKQLAGQDPAAALLAAKETLLAQWRAVSEEVEGSKRIASEIAKQQGYVTFWDRAFAAKGALRAFMLEDSVRSLNSVIAGYMGMTSLQGHTISFKPDLTIVERYGRRSGGQRRVAIISVLLGVREVIQQRSRFKASFLFLDEVFDGLDGDHMAASGQLLQVLANRYRKVMVITHSRMTGVSMAGSIGATLTSSGTTLTVKAT
jgi:DNA repair exonuclease SbcCD ATPase subunit